jgi:hypothetical protein
MIHTLIDNIEKAFASIPTAAADKDLLDDYELLLDMQIGIVEKDDIVIYAIKEKFHANYN